VSLINKVLVEFVKVLPIPVVYLFAKKYIAGKKLSDAVNAVKNLNSKGILATIDVLGESVNTKEESVEAKNECLQVLDAIKNNNLDANLSLKPTQLGLSIDEDFCFDQLTEILEKAKSYDIFVRIDMEDSSVTSATFNLHNKLKEKYPKVGVVVQAYMKRTISDVQSQNKLGTNYRLCKGIYIESPEIAYKEKQKIRDNFLEILELMFTDKNYVGIATHDDYLIEGALQLIEKYGLKKESYEFQMLYGVKENLRDRINELGHRIRIYVPFGEHWYKYSIRRLQENPNMAWYITRSLFTKN
jgi:proline dehydrogenase